MDSRASRKTVFSRFLSRKWKTSTKELWIDLRAVRWMQILLWFEFIAWVIAIAVSIAFACIHASDVDGSCMPDGSFSVNQSAYNIWRSSGFYQITLGFGHMSFALAQFIDIAFDVVSGLPIHRVLGDNR